MITSIARAEKPSDAARLWADHVVRIEVRNVYGNKVVYPVCDKAKTFAAIAGSKTLTHAILCLIERLGYEIESQADADYRTAR